MTFILTCSRINSRICPCLDFVTIPAWFLALCFTSLKTTEKTVPAFSWCLYRSVGHRLLQHRQHKTQCHLSNFRDDMHTSVNFQLSNEETGGFAFSHLIFFFYPDRGNGSILLCCNVTCRSVKMWHLGWVRLLNVRNSIFNGTLAT